MYDYARIVNLMGTVILFTISKLYVALFVILGIFFFKGPHPKFKRPHPKSKAAIFTFIGIAVVLAGAILLGSLK